VIREDAQRVVITGVGAVSPYGLGADTLWNGLKAGTSAIRPLRHDKAAQLRVRIAAQLPADVDLEGRVPEASRPLLDRATLFACIAAGEAIAQSGLDLSREPLRARSGVVIGTGAGSETTHDAQAWHLYGENATRLHPFTIVRLMMNAAASQISILHGLKGPAFVVASACASSNHAIAQAAMLIRSGLADVVVTGGTESCITLGALRAWEAMRVLAEDDCRPFSANRRGLVLGEGAAVVVLESLAHARARGAQILAELAGVGMSSDAGDIVAPDINGAAKAMSLALADAGLDASDVQYVNAHGTGTVANDIAETRALHKVFGAHAPKLAVSSTKSMHGHALGAAGALELVAVLGALRDAVVAPTLNLNVPDPACDLDYVPNQARPLTVTAALSNSFAFGGLNAVLALTRV
jgi:nodulation protein E